MPDPIDQNNPPSTPPAPLPDPQAMVDAALSTPATATTTTTTTESTTLPPTPPVAPAPSMPTVPPMPEPLVPPTLPPTPTNVAMGDDTPLAFVTPPPTTSTTTTTTTTPPVDGAAPLPPVPPAPTGSEQPKKKGSVIKKVVGVVAGVFLLVLSVGFGGYYAYLNFGGAEIPTVAYITKFTRDEDGNVIRNPAYEKLSGVAKEVNDDERDQDLGIGDYAPDPKIDAASNQSACGAAGGTWCDYGFCLKSDGTEGGCNNKAIELGYAVSYGANWSSTPKAGYTKSCTCYGSPRYFDKDGVCGGGDSSDPSGYTPETLKTGLCSITDLAPTNDGIADRINDGAGSNYCAGMFDTSGGCQKTGVPPNSKCFCGTIQIDSGHGFESTTMKCGCDKEEKTTTTVVESPPPAPVLACTGLTYTPTTTPVIGTQMTFSCEAADTPAGSIKFSYEYRYSINNGAWKTMATDRTLKPKGSLTIAACGTYKVECRACGSINGVNVCDPVWVGATQ